MLPDFVGLDADVDLFDGIEVGRLDGGESLLHRGFLLGDDAALRLGGGRFDEVQVGRVTIDVDGDALEFGEGRLSVGITAYPFR